MVNTRQVIQSMTSNYQRGTEGRTNGIPEGSSSQEKERTNENHLDQIERIVGSMVRVMQRMQTQGRSPSCMLDLYR